MRNLERITRNPEIMGGKPCLRGMRVTVGMIVGLVATGHSNAQILAAYPYLEEEDIGQALAYAAWRVEEIELPIPAA
ncbi:MAG TPA: DUF433 domain-containing protein [Terriglobia bacterium]|nr:DUF433 domain-containing protein [Terriglobia bacterium]